MKTLTFNVSGMTCDNCVHHVTEAKDNRAQCEQMQPVGAGRPAVGHLARAVSGNDIVQMLMDAREVSNEAQYFRCFVLG